MNKSHCGKPFIETIKCILVTRLKLADQLIIKDIDNGLISIEDAASFDCLHQTNDPNFYVSDNEAHATNMEREHLFSYGVEDWIEYWQMLIGVVDAWLQAEMNGNILNHLDDETLIKHF